MDGEWRIEHDSMGEVRVPAGHYWGAQTQRSVEHFPIGTDRFRWGRRVIWALGVLKLAAARANEELGRLPHDEAELIIRAAGEVMDGALDAEFPLVVFQTGSGTQSNMNANEVIANVALEKLGYEKGCYDIIHPNNHVNMCQSTNDVYPTAIRLALIFKIRELLESMHYLYDAIEDKSIEFRDVIKMGRTQLQDAVPMSLRQEFSAFAVMVGEDIERVKETEKLLREINLGATAIGTGLNAHPEYAPLAVLNLRKFTGVEVETSVNLVEATQDTGVYVQLSGVLKRVAVKLSKICNDLRLLSSGPRCGFNEIRLPAMAPGSTIMPGKVNPVIPEVVNQVAFHVIGNDVTVTFAAEAGQLQLNAMEPIIAFSLFNSITFLNNACLTLADRCIKGIMANREQCRLNIERSIGLVTALNPYIGYEKATEVAHEALETGRSVYEIVLEKGYLSQKDLDSIMSPENMIKPHYFQGG